MVFELTRRGAGDLALVDRYPDSVFGGQRTYVSEVGSPYSVQKNGAARYVTKFSEEEVNCNDAKTREEGKLGEQATHAKSVCWVNGAL